MKIDIVGWYGKKNVGDQAFYQCLAQALQKHDVAFITPPLQCRPSSDIVILGGGAVVAPFYLSILPKNKPLYALGVDIAYESEMDLLKEFPFKEILIRNSTDLNTLKNKINCKVDSIPDLAFLLKPTGRNILNRYKNNKGIKKTIGVMVTDYINPAIDRPFEKFGNRANQFKVQVSRELDRLSKEYEIILIPCSTGGYGDDRRINLDLCAYMKYHPINIMDTLSPIEMIDLIAEVDYTICMRFHAHIFSVIANKPFTSLDFTRKVALFLKENNLEYTKANMQLKENEFQLNKLELNQRVENIYDDKHQVISMVMQRIKKEWLGD
jgi:polysaccharide pyruvyl transferase WcaK-like protein